MKLPKAISIEDLKKIAYYIAGILILVLFFIGFEFYVPVNSDSQENITCYIPKGWSDNQIADNLKELGIIRSPYFFKLYAILSLKHPALQSGEYSLSPKMSVYEIVNKMVHGDVIRDKITIPEGWKLKDIAEYLELKDICKQNYFIALARRDYSEKFSFLQGKPRGVDLEGYLFPDTYEIGKKESCENIINVMLANFDKKLTPELREEISKQGKSIFDIVTMASIIEKEVITLEDKKIVSGIMWKRIDADMPLQSCATVNYITGKNDPGVSTADTKILSPYNTYRFTGLPKGPISNPGIDSITAAIYPETTDYWYFLSNGKTIFSKTLEEHNEAKAKYLTAKQ